MEMNYSVFAGDFPIDVVIEPWARVGAIEFRLMEAQQFQFPRACRNRGWATFERDRFDLMNQPRQTARNAIGICVFVERQPGAKVFGLADVENPFGLAAHDVNARLAWRSFEKLIAESLNQRSRQREQSQLRAQSGPQFRRAGEARRVFGT